MRGGETNSRKLIKKKFTSCTLRRIAAETCRRPLFFFAILSDTCSDLEPQFLQIVRKTLQPGDAAAGTPGCQPANSAL